MKGVSMMKKQIFIIFPVLCSALLFSCASTSNLRNEIAASVEVSSQNNLEERTSKAERKEIESLRQEFVKDYSSVIAKVATAKGAISMGTDVAKAKGIKIERILSVVTTSLGALTSGTGGVMALASDQDTAGAVMGIIGAVVALGGNITAIIVQPGTELEALGKSQSEQLDNYLSTIANFVEKKPINQWTEEDFLSNIYPNMSNAEAWSDIVIKMWNQKSK